MVSLERKRAVVHWIPGEKTDVSAVLAAVGKAGYEAREVAFAEGAGDSSASRHWEWNLIVGLCVTAILMTGEWAFGLIETPWFQWAAFALATIVQVFCGAQFYAGAWRQLKVGQSNMDTLVALGSTTAFGYSAWALLSSAHGHIYFMEAAAIISLVSFGHWLEARVSEKATGALRSLLDLAPKTARKMVTAGVGNGKKAPPQSLNLRSLKFTAAAPSNAQAAVTEVEVPVSELEVNDRVALRPGEHVSVDGVVLEGESAVDEAMLTGESASVDKKAGSELYAGTANLNGRLIMKVTATGEATALAHVIAAVQRAQTSRADIQRLGDRVSNVFVPVIVFIALGAALWWGLAPSSANHVHQMLAPYLWHSHIPVGIEASLIIAAAVLIVACPCAMGLATPAAIMAAANAASRRGILVRDGIALEKAGSITAVVFDKTGTLTVGRPAVVEVWESSNPKLPIAALAQALARHSNHPISVAVVSYLQGKDATQTGVDDTVRDWRELRGNGIEGKSVFANEAEATIRLGSLRWLRECGIDLAASENPANEWSKQGATVIGFARETELHALFAVRDAVKPHATETVARMGRDGLTTYLLTGDNHSTALAVANIVGISSENVFAEVRPEQKAEFIKKLQAKGERVAFVGDGINDAPALTQADLGIAVSRASDIAREAADIILLKSDIEAVPETLGLARATLRTIKQNLFWAFFYNALGVPLAALGFISPVVCAAAMGFSDLIVIGNALRLLRWRLPKSPNR